MRRWATGVTVVSAAYEGVQHGMTVSSFTSISLEPPYVLISLSRHTRTHMLVARSGRFGVTILSEAQQDISDRFAGRTPDDQDRFVDLETYTLVTGAPLLEGGLVGMDCKVQAAYEVGTHTLFVGEIIALSRITPGEPLLYYNRDYHELCDPPEIK
jgi:flavin reductase (DIM6/NTAB) family NADH-FMN oxidoreductase RutF